MACNEVNASLTSSLETHGDGVISLKAGFSQDSNIPRWYSEFLNLGQIPTPLLANLTSSLEASFHEIEGYHTFELKASLLNPVPLNLCGFAPLT